MFYTSRDYWAEFREVEASLPDFVFIMSIEEKITGRAGGVVVEATREVAARSIVSKTHRLATPAEIETHRAAEQQRAEAALAEARRKAGLGTYVLPAAKGKR